MLSGNKYMSRGSLSSPTKVLELWKYRNARRFPSIYMLKTYVNTIQYSIRIFLFKNQKHERPARKMFGKI